MSENLDQSTIVSMETMREAFVVYRSVMHRIISAADIDIRYESMRRLAQVRCQYREAIEAMKSRAFRTINQYLAYYRYLLHIEKTIAGLVQLIVQHAVRKFSTARLPLSIFCRVRQLTVTHPAIAPPQLA